MTNEMSPFAGSSHARLLGRALFLAFLIPATLAAQDRVVFDNAAFEGARAPVPHWDGSYLITREAEILRPGEPAVRLYNRQGENVRQASIWFPEARRVTVRSAAVTADGRIVASGSLYKGAAYLPDAMRTGYIVLTDLSGAAARVLETGDFSPSNVCVAPDGTVWSFGEIAWDKATAQPKPGLVLRHFDFEKGEIGAFVPRSTFPVRPPFDALTHMRCTSSKVVIYSSSASVYIELPYGSDAPVIHQAIVPPDFHVIGFAALETGEIYGQLWKRGGGDKRGEGLHILNRDAAARIVRWLPVESAAPETGAVAQLWGADGERLVLSRAQDPAGRNALYWSVPRTR